MNPTPFFSSLISGWTGQFSSLQREVGSQRITVVTGEFWTSRQRQGHSLHEVSYRACFKPQLPGFFIGQLCEAGDALYDPFMGRGTALIEGCMRGLRVVGNDANPLSRVLVEPRLAPPKLARIWERIESVDLTRSEDAPEDLLVFFYPDTLREISAWRRYFRERRASGAWDAVDAWLQMVACNRLTGHSPGFFSVYTLPPNQATSVAAQRVINAKRGQVPPARSTKALLWKKSRQLLGDVLPRNYGAAGYELHTSSAEATNGIAGESIDLVVTSPPFLDIVNYKGDNWMRNWFTETEGAPQAIWQCREISDWKERMLGTMRELRRVLRPGGVVAFEVGEVRKGTVALDEEVVLVGGEAGLQPIAVMMHVQNFTKTANCWGVDNNKKGTNTQRIVIFQK